MNPPARFPRRFVLLAIVFAFCLLALLFNHPDQQKVQAYIKSYTESDEKDATLSGSQEPLIDGEEEVVKAAETPAFVEPPLLNTTVSPPSEDEIDVVPTEDVVPSEGSSCATSLLAQTEQLKTIYGKLLAGVTHVAMVGFPNHRNKGDSAIWAGEIVLLEALGIEVAYVTCKRKDYDADVMRDALMAHGGPEHTAIMFHGGGNFGDIWWSSQILREKVAEDFPDFPIRSFPQTYYFSNATHREQAQRIYGAHPDLQLTVRDSKSFAALQKDFGATNEVIMTPDAATMLSLLKVEPITAPTKVDFLIQARIDGEGGQDHRKDSAIFEELELVVAPNGTEIESTVLIDDWFSFDPSDIKKAPYNEKASLRVESARQWLSSGGLVLSDRLHAHILSTIWGIPHIMIEEGDYGKVRGYHDTWLRECEDRVLMTSSVREGVEAAKAWYRKGGLFS